MKSSNPVGEYALAQYLFEEGLIPDACVNVRFNVGIDGIVMLTYDVQLTEDRLARFQRAFSKYLDDREKEVIARYDSGKVKG